MDEKVTAVTKLTAHEGRGDELVERLKQLAAIATGEEGTEVYLVNRVNRAPDTLFLHEVFRDREALKAHGRNAQEAGISLADLVASSEVLIGHVVASR